MEVQLPDIPYEESKYWISNLIPNALGELRYTLGVSQVHDRWLPFVGSLLAPGFPLSKRLKSQEDDGLA